MALIDAEQDEAAVLRAEDEAIRDAEKPPEPDKPEPNYAKLIEDLTRDPEALQQG